MGGVNREGSMVLPSLVVGNELLILGGVSFVVGAWFLAHRHGRLHGMVDANKMAWATMTPFSLQAGKGFRDLKLGELKAFLYQGRVRRSLM